MPPFYLLFFSIDPRHSLPHFDVTKNIKNEIMKERKTIPKDMPILCIPAVKRKVATLGK